MAANNAKTTPWDWAKRYGAVTGLAALVACMVGAMLFPSLFLRSYLVAYSFWLNVAVGSLAILMVYHLTGGAWGFLSRRVLESSVRTLPLLAILFVPILLGLSHIYPWPESLLDIAAPHKKSYLTVPWFLARTAVYFLVWIILGWLLTSWSRREDHALSLRPTSRMRTLSGPGLVLYFLAMTFAAVDWYMSLQPTWYSTIFPVVIIIGQALEALAFTILVVAALSVRPPLAELVAPQYFRDLGNLLLALVMFWTYVTFSQFLLIWMANLPEEVIWYTTRFHGGWKWLAVGLMLLQFAIPFLVLLPRRTKQSRERLSAVAGLLLATSFLVLFWQIIPAAPAPEYTSESVDIYGLLSHLAEFVVAVIAFVGIGGIWLAAFAWQLGGMPLVAAHDPTLKEVHAHG